MSALHATDIHLDRSLPSAQLSVLSWIVRADGPVSYVRYTAVHRLSYSKVPGFLSHMACRSRDQTKVSVIPALNVCQVR